MAYIVMGLSAVVAGLVLLFASDSPGIMVRSEWYALLVVAGGVALVLIGMVVQVVEVNRADRGRT